MEYDSDSDSGEANAQELENGSRSVYLITYSQADKAVFPTQEDFALGVEKSFSTGKAKVVQWCCSEEEHRNKGKHYHIVVKLTQNQRWLTSKRFLMENYGVSVHYSSAHHDYYSAWRYVTKSDKDFVQSENHPCLREAPKPKTTNASRARCTKRKVKRPARHSSAQDTLLEDKDEEGERPTARKRKKRLTAFEVSQIMVEGNIKNLIELQALAFEQKEEGKTDLAEFRVNRTPRAVADMMQSTWEIEEAKAKLERAKKTRMELLQEARRSECAQGCNGDWLSCAEEILHNNGLSVEYFGELVRDLLSKGRGKSEM